MVMGENVLVLLPLRTEEAYRFPSSLMNHHNRAKHVPVVTGKAAASVLEDINDIVSRSTGSEHAENRVFE